MTDLRLTSSVEQKFFRAFFYDTFHMNIGCCTTRYATLYEIIRAVNHEELHAILYTIDRYASKTLDMLVHSGKYNSKFKEELYELGNRDTDNIAKYDLILDKDLVTKEIFREKTNPLMDSKDRTRIYTTYMKLHGEK